MNDIKTLISWIKDSNNIVFFGGAGVSTESGLKDFRSKDGLYNEQYKYPPEIILSHTFFINHTKDFFEFYRNKLNTNNLKPNITHIVLNKLEKKNKLKCIITQNIDGLDIKAGSKNVLEIHGSIYRNYCVKCNKFYSAQDIFKSSTIPKCECGGIIKPDVVLYEEPLNETFERSIEYIRKCDTLIVAGTSLTVYPAASLIRYFNGKNLILINKDKTKYDELATLVFNQNMSDIFKEL